MPNTRYENFVLSNRLEDQLSTHLNLLDFVTINNELTATAGTIVKVNTYSATGKAQVVAEREGNTETIAMSYTTKEYTVKTTQARFEYTDEDEMTDPFLVDGGIKNLSVALTNKLTEQVMAEYGKATLSVNYSTSPTFNDFVDGLSKLNFVDDAAGSESNSPGVFALLNRKSKAMLQKGMKDELKYVEDYIRQGYIGHIAGVPIRVCDVIPEGQIVIATREAVTYFRKKGTETEQERDKNRRINTIYGRMVGFPALTDAGKIVLLKPSA